MDNIKIGEFIKELRIEKNLTQYELAELIHISREAVSRWECGKSCPDPLILLSLSETFKVSINEILAGERKTEYNKDKIENVTLNILKEKNKLKKSLKITIAIIIILILMFPTLYFINNYNTIKIFTISGSNNNITINDGIFVTTKEKMYFNLGKITSSNDLNYLKVYYIENNKQKIIYEGKTDYLTLYDYYGYDAYFDYNNVNEIIANIYVEITDENNNQTTIKLSLKKEFSNNKFSFSKLNKIKKDNKINKEYFKSKLNTTNIKKKFKKDNDGYIYIDLKENIRYVYLEDLLTLNITNDKTSEKVYIDLDNLNISYYKYNNDALVEQFDYNSELICNLGKCSNAKHKIEAYINKLNEILR